MFTVYLSFHVCHVTFHTSVSVHAEAIECVALATASSEDVLVCVLSWRLTAVSSEMQKGGRWFLMRLTDIKPHFQMHCKDSWNSWALTPGVSVCGGFRAAACGEAANISHHELSIIRAESVCSVTCNYMKMTVSRSKALWVQMWHDGMWSRAK